MSEYKKPQTFIYSNLRRLSSATTPDHVATIIGRQFYLSRYTNSSERENLSGTLYNGKDTIIPYEECNPLYSIDKDFVRIFIEGGFVNCYTTNEADTNKWFIYNSKLNKVQMRTSAATSPTTGDSVDISSIHGRSVQKGDVVYLDGRIRTVMGIEKELVPGSFETSVSTSNPLIAESAKPSSDYDGTNDVAYKFDGIISESGLDLASYAPE